jgi:hypothetical protein
VPQAEANRWQAIMPSRGLLSVEDPQRGGAISVLHKPFFDQ